MLVFTEPSGPALCILYDLKTNKLIFDYSVLVLFIRVTNEYRINVSSVHLYTVLNILMLLRLICWERVV